MEHSEYAYAADTALAADAPDGALSGAEPGAAHEADAAMEEGHAPAPESAAGVQAEESAAAQEDAPQDATHDAQAVRAHITQELESLVQDGWTTEQLRSFAADEQAQRDVSGGMTARQAATAYLMRRAQEPPRAAKRAVPAIRSATAGSVPRTHAIDRMSSSEFARFSDGLYERLLAGEKITL